MCDRWQLTMFLIILTGLYSISLSMAFNIETRHYTSYRRESSSMFGFSVAEYRDSSRRGWVIVGAPEAQTSQPSVYRGGSVYRCDVVLDDKCVPIEFDSKGHNMLQVANNPDPFIQIDNKTLQWFGATVSTSSREGGPILACAPRYVFFSVQGNRDNNDNSRQPVGNRRDPVGTCWITNNLHNSTEFAPCRTRNFGYHRQGSCQAGLGATVSRNGERIFIGAPGSWYWQGQLFSIARRLDNIPFVPPGLGSHFGDTSGQVYTQTVNNRGKVMYTKEGSPEEDDSYLGYSLTSGDFLGNGDVGSAVGMPRGYGLHGKVVLLTSNMTNHRNITGEQMGSYFGYSLAVGDMDGDHLDDLIVGAPMFTIPDNPEMTFETGRIYVFYGRGPNKYAQVDWRDGESNRGRFGLSVASLGDLDLDGYDDFAVGGPYAGPEGRGAVYIYQGSAQGVLKKYSQVIYAVDLSDRVYTFGFSVAGSLDLDGNNYPDMVVGSYESGTAMFFRARPVIKMIQAGTYVEFQSASKLVSLDEQLCTLSNGVKVTCLPLKTCIQYDGIGVSHRYDFNVEYILDVKKTTSPRMFFLEYEGKSSINRTITIEKDRQLCRTVNVYLSQNIRDKLISLDAEMRMSLVEERWIDDRPRDPRLPLRPVLATTSTQKDSISIRKNCGDDNICEPDLRLTCSSEPKEYLLGSGERLELDVIVRNMDEDAFEATYYLTLPLGIDYIKIEKIMPEDIPVQCSAPKSSNNNTLKCDIGNPLPHGYVVRFKVFLQPIDVHGEKSTYDFYMEVNSTNSEPADRIRDNILHIPTGILVNSKLSVEGESKPKDLYYNPLNYTVVNATTDIEFGPEFIHNYTIRNKGPSRIEAGEIFLIWPTHTLARDEFVYLLQQPVVSGNMICGTANSNHLALKIGNKRKSLTYYEMKPGYESWKYSNKNINVHTGYDEADDEKSQTGTEINRGRVATSAWIPPSPPPPLPIGGSSGGQVVINTGANDRDASRFGDGSGPIGDLSSIYTTTPSNSFENNGFSQNGDGAWKKNYTFHNSSRTGIILDNGEVHSDKFEVNVENTHTGREETLVKIHQTESEKNYNNFNHDLHGENRRKEMVKHQEEERIRLQEEAFIAKQKREEEERQHRIRLYGGGSGQLGGEHHEIIGDREEHVGTAELGIIGGDSSKITSASTTTDLHNFLGTLKETVGYEVFNRQGHQYLQFLGRFRVSAADGKEYIEFKDGSIFPLFNKYGEQNYGTKDNLTDKFMRIEGEIIIGEDGIGYCRLNDNRRFPLRGSSWSTAYLSEEHNFTLSGGSDSGAGSMENINLRTTQDALQGRNGQIYRQESQDNSKGDSWERQLTNQHEHYGEQQTVNTRTYTSGNAALDNIENYKDRQNRRRFKREISSFSDNGNVRLVEPALIDKTLRESAQDDEEILRELGLCANAHCVVLRCFVGRLEKDEEVSISARFSVKGTTLNKISAGEKLNVTTTVYANVTKLPFIGRPHHLVSESHQVVTVTEPTASVIESSGVPLWVVVLSAVAGTIILLLLIYLLHKCGFFKRNRPTDAPERQPLNRNGHFQQGDDHL